MATVSGSGDASAVGRLLAHWICRTSVAAARKKWPGNFGSGVISRPGITLSASRYRGQVLFELGLAVPSRGVDKRLNAVPPTNRGLSPGSAACEAAAKR
jgi:hypothetical protein